MDKPAAIEGCYVDLKFMPGIKCARVSIDIPIEHSNAFLKMFDAPDRANPVPVVVARLATSPAEQSSSRLSGDTENGPDGKAPDPKAGRSAGPATPVAEAQGQDKPRTYTRSQIAAMKCQDQEFQVWLGGSECRGNARWCNQLLKGQLDIMSKSELDVEGPKAQAFDKLLASFDYRNQVR